MKKVAFIAMRYGKEINGGAELLCRMIAERMTRHWQIDVLTTCAVDYVRWKNELPPGRVKINGVNVQHFQTSRERSTRLFGFIYDILALRVKWQRQSNVFANETSAINKLKAAVRSLYCFFWGPYFLGRLTESLWMWLQGPSSKDLRRFIKSNKDQFDAFIFFTNTYATTYENIPLVADKALVVPAAHDEPCLYFNMFEQTTKSAKGFIYSTPEEKVLFESRYPFVTQSFNRVTGVGIDKRHQGSNERFRHKYGIVGDYVVYVGRIEEGKGCHTLFDYFLKYCLRHQSSLKLVLMGKPAMDIPNDPRIQALGFVSEDDKFDGISGADCLIMPSPYESLSIVLLEAWMSNVPVLVNGLCSVLKGQCERSKGGLTYSNFEEFLRSLDKILKDQSTAEKMAASGKEFAEKTYIWAKIEQDYIDAVNSLVRN